jgi:methionine synthase II (cobalamin-independent)
MVARYTGQFGDSDVNPPYRADQVGSFLRPSSVKVAHTAYARGELPLDQLREIENRAIIDVLELQKQVGVDVLSDGEFRRGGWSGDFIDAVDGFVEGTQQSASSTPRPAMIEAGSPADRCVESLEKGCDRSTV